MNTKSNRNHSNQLGFTLIEIMVALAIGAFLIGGISQVYISLKQTNRVADSISDMQETARLNLDMIYEDLSHTGFIGCADPLKKPVYLKYSGSDNDAFFFRDNSLRGWDVTGTGWGGADGLDAIDDTGARQARLNSDVFSTMFLSRSNVNLATAIDSQTDDVDLDSDLFVFEQEDIAAVGDCDNVSVFAVTNADSSTSLKHSSTYNKDGNLGATFLEPANTKIRLFLNNTYFVGDTGRTNSVDNPIYALYRHDRLGNIEEIAEGVENMQVLYGEEINSNDCNTANRFRFVNASDADINMANVSIVKIGFLIASNEPVLSNDDTTTYTVLDQAIARFGTAATYENDRRLRKTLNLTVSIRNREMRKECTY